MESPTGDEKPPIEVTVTVAVVASPCRMLTLDGSMVSAKSCADETCRSSSVECSVITAAVPVLPEPVIVIGYDPA